MSSPAPESPSGKKKGLKKRLLRLFSRSEAKEKPRTRSEGDKSCTAGETGQLDRKGRWGRKDRQEPQEGAESLPRLRNPKSEDGILRRSSRETKTRSLSYSELELPASSFLQRFGSLTWRKKRFSALDYSNASTPTVSTPAQSHWSVGRLDRPAVGNELDLENRRPNSCIVEYPFPQLTPKNSEQSPNREPKTLEVSTSFDCVANDEDDKSSSQRTTKGKNVQLPFPFPERLEGEEEESLPCWAESILKDYMSQDQPTPGSPLHPLSRDSHTLQTMEQHEEPDRYRSPLYHRIVSKNLIQEEHVPPVKMPVISSICIETMEQNKQFDVQQTVLCNAKKIEASERTTKQIPLYNSIPVDVAQIRTGQKCINLSVEAAQNNASSFPDPLKLSTEYSLGKKACSTNNQTSLAYRNNLQDGLQKKIHNGHRQVIVHEPAHSLSESSIVSQAKMKDDCKPQQSPNPAKMRYEVIITMTKEEKEQELLPSLAQELVKAEELVGQDLRMSPSLESRACGCHGAGLTDVTAEEISEISDQTEKNTAQEEEILENKRGGETPKGPQLNRSIRSTVDEEFFITASGSDQVAESCRLYSSNMEKPDNQQKVFELPRTSNKKDNDFTKLSYGHVSPQLYEGHVKGLQKVFENISTKDNVIHHKETPKSQQYGSLREKKHKVPQEMPATPGVHTPVYSKVFNPLRKDHFEKRNEHVIVTVIDGSEKSDTSPVSTTSQINIGSNKKCLETKSSAKKYIENVELTNRYHSGNEASYRKARAQLPDLNLPPRIPTPPPYRTKNNVSISLSSPRGWKNESVIVRSPMSLVAQRFENQRNNFSLNPSQTSANFFFSGGSISHAKSSSELQQNVKKFEENRIQPRDITKSHHLKNSQESNTVDLKSLSTANMLHVVSHIVDEKEALHSKSFEALANTINNEIQEDSTVNKDSGLVDIKERFKDKHVAKRILIEDRHYQDIGNLDMKDLKSRGKEVCVQETMNTSTIDSHLGHDIPPMIIPKRKPPDYLHDAYINHKLKHTLKKKLEDSHDLNKHNASHGMDLNYTTVDSMPVENRDYIGRDLRANQQVKNKHQPTVILCTFVNQVNDSIHLTKRKNNDEIRHYGASLSDQPFEEETKIKLKHEAEELKNNHAKFIQCNVKSNLEPSTNTLYEYQSKTTVNQGKPLTDQSEGEVFTMLNKDEDTVDLETDITSSADNNEEGKTDVPDRADGDLSTVTLNKEVIEIQIELPEIDILEDYNGFEQPVGDIQMDKIVKMAIMQKDKYLTKVTKFAPFNKEVKESHIRQQEMDISEDNAFEQPLGDIQMDQVEKVAIMQNDTYLTEVNEEAPINKEVIESHIRQQETDISEDNAFEQPVGDIQMGQVEKVAIMQNDTYLTEVTDDAPINKEVIESHRRQQEIDISEDNAFEQPLGDIQMDQVEKVAIMQNDTYLTEVNEDAPINKEVKESHIRQQEVDISEDNAFEQPLGDIQMGQVEKVAIMQNDTYLTEVNEEAPINKEVIESHIRQQEIDISEDNAFEQPLGDIQMDQVEKVAIMQNDTYLIEVTDDAPINKEVIESHIRQQEMDISEDNGFVLNKAEDKTGEELSNTEYNNHKVDKEVNNQELHYIVSVTTINGQMDYVNDFEHNQILRNVGSVDILEQAENEEGQLTDQLVNNVKDGSSLAEDKSKYEQNINASDLLSTDTLDHALHKDSNPNTVGTTVMGHGQNVEVSVEIKREHMENVSDISENSTVVKNTVTVIQEKTNEMDINTVDMTDQSILIAAVAEDEPVTHETDIFANDMTVSTEVEQSKEIIKIAESKDPAAQEVIVLVDSSIEISEQTFNNFKEDLDNMLNTDVNANHMSDTHLLHTNTAQTGDVIVDYNNQNTDLLSERHENGAEQASDVISQFVNNKVRETTILVSEEDCGIFTKDKDKVIINPPVNEFVDQTSELVNDQAEQDGNISSAEGLTVDNSNSTGEAAQSTLRQSDKTQNISDILGQNTSLTGENEENDSIFAEKVIEQPLVEIQMNQVEKVAIMQNDKCLTKVTEDAVFDKEDALEPGAKKIDLTNERHEHTRVKNTNDSLTCIDSKNSIDDQPSENTQMGKDIANHVTDEISQWKGLDDNLLLSEHKAEHLNDQSPTLYSSGMQTTSQLPETNEFQRRKNIDTHESNFYSSLKLNGDISGIPLLNVEKNNPANYGNMSNVNTIDPQVHQNSVEQTTRIFQHFHLTDSENNLNDATLTEHARNCADEEEAESSENMEMWVSKLRQLETPEFMKYLREPRQPRCSALSMYATLPPIKEDQGSPKSDCLDFRVALPEIKEKEISPEEGESTVETKVLDQTEKSEEDEKKYSWERNIERSTVSSSPLELMRKHSGDEVSRSDSYKAFIAQNISQRQSSIIGSLLLSEKLDKKTDTSEGKSYSRLESSFLLSSYLKPQKDKLEVTKETETVSENSISENDTDTATTNDTLTSTTRDPNQEDNVDGSIPKVNRITEIDSTERPSKLEIPVSSPIKVFPDVWHHPGKSHGKLNPRPGKIILFSEPGFKGHSYQIYSDVGNACEWELQGKISVRIIRGGWLLYEKPYFRGRRVMLLEGDTDLTCPWEVQDKSSKDPQRDTTKPKSWIGSLRHVVRDFQVPRISLFLDENGEGNKITILGATSDSCVNGQPIKTESIIVHSGLWLVYSKPFFEGDPYILEPGGYPNRNAWNGHDSHLCSLQPARIGGPTVEKPNEPKILLFQHPEFKGHSWEVTRDLHSLQGEPNQQGERLTSVGSLKVLGGCWVAYEKEGFHGHQYLLEEGEYQKWSRWGGCTEELGSLRHIRTDFSEPEIILYEKPGCLEGSCLRLNEALADIEVADYGTSTGSIQVLNGVWVAYENVDFSGEQYILEKGIYHSFHDWGAKDSQICAVQPVLQVGGQSLQYLPKIQLFSEPNFHGDCMTNTEDRILLPKNFSPQSCRIEGSSWILYEGEDCCGEQFILVEGDYPTPTAMGCHARSIIQSLKKVPLYFSIPSISLHGLERFEGKELEFTGSVRSLQGEGYNNHVMSVKVASGIWVLYEHSDFRGRQWLLEQTQITNWLLFSGTQRIGSLCPIRQRRVYFRLRNHALGLFLCVSEPAENMKAARVQVSEPREGSGDLWYYEEGRIKNQMTPQMSLQVVGMTSPGTKVVMWSEGRKPIQTWTIEDTGLIMSCLFEGLCLDIKGGHSYDSDHVVVWETAEDRLTQQWDLEVF